MPRKFFDYNEEVSFVLFDQKSKRFSGYDKKSKKIVDYEKTHLLLWVKHQRYSVPCLKVQGEKIYLISGQGDVFPSKSGKTFVGPGREKAYHMELHAARNEARRRFFDLPPLPERGSECLVRGLIEKLSESGEIKEYKPDGTIIVELEGEDFPFSLREVPVNVSSEINVFKIHVCELPFSSDLIVYLVSSSPPYTVSPDKQGRILGVQYVSQDAFIGRVRTDTRAKSVSSVSKNTTLPEGVSQGEVENKKNSNQSGPRTFRSSFKRSRKSMKGSSLSKEGSASSEPKSFWRPITTRRGQVSKAVRFLAAELACMLNEKVSSVYKKPIKIGGEQITVTVAKLSDSDIFGIENGFCLEEGVIPYPSDKNVLLPVHRAFCAARNVRAPLLNEAEILLLPFTVTCYNDEGEKEALEFVGIQMRPAIKGSQVLLVDRGRPYNVSPPEGTFLRLNGDKKFLGRHALVARDEKANARKGQERQKQTSMKRICPSSPASSQPSPVQPDPGSLKTNPPLENESQLLQQFEPSRKRRRQQKDPSKSKTVSKEVQDGVTGEGASQKPRSGFFAASNGRPFNKSDGLHQNTSSTTRPGTDPGSSLSPQPQENCVPPRQPVSMLPLSVVSGLLFFAIPVWPVSTNVGASPAQEQSEPPLLPNQTRNAR